MDTKGYAFVDLVDVQQLTELMDLFHSISGIPSAVFNPDGRILIATGWKDLCTRFHRMHPVTAARCKESDNYIKKRLHREKYVEYKCKNGLWDVAVPILVEDRHMGTLFLGQFFFEDQQPSLDFFRKQAERFGFNADEYLAALNRIPVFSREAVQGITNYMLGFVKMLSTLGHQNLKLAREIIDRKQVEESFRLRTQELDCLYSISNLVERRGNVLGETIQGIVDLIPSALRFPESTCARVMLKDQAYQTRDYEETERKHTHDIYVHDDRIGLLEVCQFRKGLSAKEEAIWNEEHKLVRVIGERLGRIIERNQAEEALKQSQEQLYQAQKMETLGALIAGVAHEINNPINLVMFNIPLIQKIWRDLQPVMEEQARKEPERKYAGLTHDFLSENVGQLLSDMEMGANRVAKTIADLKDYAKKSDTTERNLFSINTAVENVLRLAKTTIRKSEVELNFQLGSDLPLMEGNLQSIEQILLNLVINAIQAIDHDRGKVLLVTGTDRETCRIRVSITDNGRGIEASMADRLFDPFVTSKHKEGGLGLGLAITYNLVRAHNGEVRFESVQGKGTTFTVLFPSIKQ